MFLILFGARVRSLWNSGRAALDQSPWVAAGLTGLGVIFVAVIFGAFRVLLQLGANPAARQGLVYDVFYFLFLFLLAGAVPFVAGALLHAGDVALLGSAPVPSRSIVAMKLIDATVTNSLQFSVIGLPALAACGSSLGLPPLGWGILIALMLLFVLLPALITALLLLISVLVMGMARVRAAISVVNTLLALFVCMTIVIQVSNLQLKHGVAWSNSLSGASSSTLARIGPSAWFADALVSYSLGLPSDSLAQFAKIMLLTGTLFVTCLVLGERVLRADAYSDEGSNFSPQDEGLPPRGGLTGRLAGPLGAVLLKDLRAVIRDSVLLSQLSMPLILFLVPIALGLQPSFRAMAGSIELYPFAAGMTAIVVFMQSSIISLSSIGLESRGFWIVSSSPGDLSTALRAKLVLSALITSTCGIVMTLLGALLFRAPFLFIVSQCGIVLLCSIGLSGLGVGIAAAFPRFIYENPAHRVSAWALILGFMSSAAYVLIIGAVFAIGFAIAAVHPLLSHVALGLTWCAAGIITCGFVIGALAIGVARLRSYEWIHN